MLWGLVVQGAAVLNRWSASWRDQSRHERVGGVGGQAVGQANVQRKGTARRTRRAPALRLCVLLESEEQEDHVAGEE